MKTKRLVTLIGLAFCAQGALANTIWLKDRQGNVCLNPGSTNPGGVIGYGGINRDGSGFTLTISNPEATKPTVGDCKDIPATQVGNPIVFSSSTIIPRLNAVHMRKPGTGSVQECLAQGTNLIGLSGVSLSGNGPFRLVLSTVFTDGCNLQTQANITPDGQPVIIRTAAIFSGGGERPLFNGGYHIYNVASVPEPGTVLLLLMGVMSLTATLSFAGQRRSSTAPTPHP